MFFCSLCCFSVQAPGTFGYNHSKYRPPRNDSESIPLDQDGSGQRPQLPNEVLPTMHEELNGSKSKQQPSASPAPISRYLPPDMQVVAPFAGMVPVQQQRREQTRLVVGAVSASSCEKCTASGVDSFRCS
ncbi:hypothetical protein BYT27DRAFT_7204981 [Phlegmacium glaucopus]|nr:hypothetical protein BYT27DRAFT_7204981 [Phlegmacium glaucopus]